MKIKKKFKYIFLALIVMAISYNAFENDSELEVNASGLSEQEILANVDALKRLEAAETSAIEEKIQAVQLEISKSEEEKSLQVKSHKNGFRKAFESVVFMGDSQAEPLSLYGYADSSSVIASKGRNVISAKDDVKKAASLMNVTTRAALLGMLAKHLISLSDMCIDKKMHPVEKWEEKITDSINYLFILRAIVEEELNEKN